MKLTPKHIRSFIQEELSHLMEAPGKKDTPLNAAIPSLKFVEIDKALYPVAFPEAIADDALGSPGLRAARAAMGAGTQKASTREPTELYRFHKNLKERASMWIGVNLLTIAPSWASACKGDVASAVMLYFGVTGLIPGHDEGAFIGFESNKDLNKYLKLIKDAARSTKDSGIIGGVDCFYTLPPEPPPAPPPPNFSFEYDKGRVTVGVSPVFNQFTQTVEPAVVIIFGSLGEHQSSGQGGPYYIQPDEALLMAREYERLATPYMQRNKGLSYHYPTAVEIPDELATYCGQIKADQIQGLTTKKQSSPAPNADAPTVPGFKT
jgi:hypothetical protein